MYLPLWRGLGGGKTAENPPPAPSKGGDSSRSNFAGNIFI